MSSSVKRQRELASTEIRYALSGGYRAGVSPRTLLSHVFLIGVIQIVDYYFLMVCLFFLQEDEDDNFGIEELRAIDIPTIALFMAVLLMVLTMIIALGLVASSSLFCFSVAPF